MWQDSRKKKKSVSKEGITSGCDSHVQLSPLQTIEGSNPVGQVIVFMF